jgi:hypothetical protein
MQLSLFCAGSREGTMHAASARADSVRAIILYSTYSSASMGKMDGNRSAWTQLCCASYPAYALPYTDRFVKVAVRRK